jgi:VanZ family protein
MASQQCSGRQIEPLAVLDQRRPASTWHTARSSLIVPVTYSWGVAKLHYPAAMRFWTIAFSRIAGWGSGMALDAGTALERPVLCPERNYFAPRSIAASADRFRTVAKACCVPIVILLVIAALGPAKWAPRTQLGWQFDHLIGYFGITLFVCFAWPRPFVVGGVFAAVAALLEGLQAFTPDRSAYLPAIFYGAAGALAAALVAELVGRLWIWLLRREVEVNVRRARSKSLAYTGSPNPA